LIFKQTNGIIDRKEDKNMAIEKILGIDGSSISWSCKQVASMVKKGTLSFDNVIQRSFVWERSRQSMLIWSVIMGYPIPPIYAKRGDSENSKIKIYDVLDGQQRCTTIKMFVYNEFKLSKLPPIPYLDENNEENILDISGLTFEKLPEELRDSILGKMMTFYYYDDLSKEEQAQMFKNLNNGKPLSSKSRMLASLSDIESILNLGSHPLFEDMLSEKKRKNKDQATIVMKAWCMLNISIEEVSFRAGKFNPLMERTVITEEEKMDLKNIFDFIYDTNAKLLENVETKVSEKLYTETNFVSLIPFFDEALGKDIDDKMMADWLVSFFDTYDGGISVSEEYNNACISAVADNGNIQKRHWALKKSFDEFFKEE